jgi:hypothetical protein
LSLDPCAGSEKVGADVGLGTGAPAPPRLLTKENYYSSPSTRDLIRRTDSEGNCRVENFEVGHTEWGKVLFLGTMNLKGINLNDASESVRYKLVNVWISS